MGLIHRLHQTWMAQIVVPSPGLSPGPLAASPAPIPSIPAFTIPAFTGDLQLPQSHPIPQPPVVLIKDLTELRQPDHFSPQ